MIPVNKPFLPDFNKYTKYLQRAFDNNWLTNNGPLVQELKIRLEEYLGVKNLLPVANGTLAMQVAYKTFRLKGNVLTTPFTFIATSSSLQWEGLKPKFVDVDYESYNLCSIKCAKAIDSATSAILPVHVYGNPCDVVKFEKLGIEKNLKIIFDAAHTFGVKLGNRSILSYGDASTLSFHATKIFHSTEGGAVIFKSNDDYERAKRIINFGIDPESSNIVEPGINAKMSEVHAAMGLAVLDEIDHILEHRASLFNQYVIGLTDVVKLPLWHEDASLNGAYMPISFSSKSECSRVLEDLESKGINARRYFNPSLNTLEIYRDSETTSCPLSEDLALRTICLPLYFSLSIQEVKFICRAVKSSLESK